MKWMDYAYKEAQKAFLKDEVPVGAVIVKEGKLYAKAFNLKELRKKATAHAEVLVVEKASKKKNSWRLDDCELYVTLEPCLMCLSVLYQARIKKIYFGAFDKKAGAISLGYQINADTRLNHRFEVEYLPYPLSEKLLKDFFKNIRKRTGRAK